MSTDGSQWQVEEFGRLSLRHFGQVVDAEIAPFGEAVHALQFRPKSHHIGVRDDEGALIAVVGCDVVTVEVEGYGAFDVVGYGSLIVRHDHRHAGVGRFVMDRVERYGRGLGVPVAALLCAEHLVGLYRCRGFEPVASPVWVEQDTGPIVYPGVMMWKPLRAGATWPAGTIRIHGYPF